MSVRLAAACLMAILALASGRAVAADLGQAGQQYAALPPDCVPTDGWSFIAPIPIDLVIGPGHDYDRLAVIPPCTRVHVILCEYRTAWCKVRYGRYDGWLFDRTLRFSAIRYPLGH